MTTNTTPEKPKAKVKSKAKKDYSLMYFLHSVIFLIFVFTGSFMTFLYKNRYPMIVNDEILPEVLYSLIALAVIAFVSLFFLSISKFLMRVWLATASGACLAYVLGVLYPDNIGVMLSGYVSFLPQMQLDMLMNSGNLYVGVAGGFLLFLLLLIFRGGAMSLLSLPTIAAVIFLFNMSSKQVIPEIYKGSGTKVANVEVKEGEEAPEEKNENIIYLMFENHVSYRSAVETAKEIDADKIANSNLNPSFIKDFYQSNDFKFYPDVYTKYKDKLKNVASVLNPYEEKVGVEFYNRDDASYFTNSNDQKLVLLKNDVFKKLQEDGYKLNIYQTYPFDFCKGYGKMDRCVTYPAPMGALYQTDLEPGQRFLLLIGHILQSIPVGKTAVAFLQEKFPKLDVPFINASYSESLPIGQADVIHRLSRDVSQAKGKNVFFAHVDLPMYPYIYNENCQLNKNPMKWREQKEYGYHKDYRASENSKRAYMQQTACLYGQLQYMINELSESKALDNTKIIIHGDQADGIQKSAVSLASKSVVERTTEEIKDKDLTIYAIYEPNKKFEFEKKICDIETLIKKDLYADKDAKCEAYEYRKEITDDIKVELKKWFENDYDKLLVTTGDYKKVYQTWLEKGGQEFMSQIDQRMKQQDKALEGKINFVAPPKLKPSKEKKDIAFVPVPEAKAPADEPSVELPKIEDKPADAENNTVIIEEQIEKQVDIKTNEAKPEEVKKEVGEKVPSVDKSSEPKLPVVEMPNVETPKLEASVEAPKTELPTVEVPKVETAPNVVEATKEAPLANVPPKSEIVLEKNQVMENNTSTDVKVEETKNDNGEVKKVVTTTVVEEVVVKTIPDPKPEEPAVKVPALEVIDTDLTEVKQISLPKVDEKLENERWKNVNKTKEEKVKNNSENVVDPSLETNQQKEEIVGIEKTTTTTVVTTTSVEGNHDTSNVVIDQNAPVVEKPSTEVQDSLPQPQQNNEQAQSVTETSVENKTEVVENTQPKVSQEGETSNTNEVNTKDEKQDLSKEDPKPRERKPVEDPVVAERIENAIKQAEERQKIANEQLTKEQELARQRKQERLEQSDFTKEVTFQKENERGETDTYIYIETIPNPNKKVNKPKTKELDQELIKVDTSVERDLPNIQIETNASNESSNLEKTTELENTENKKSEEATSKVEQTMPENTQVETVEKTVVSNENEGVVMGEK
ncbi:MAG: hypothetical protein MJ247_07075 [Alphaproteobacteria bacterium]|nr:hypothetical protein [Alphaproteobacteria bacterium]